MTTAASLNPIFLTYLEPGSCEGHDRLQDADGVAMDCPGCRRHRVCFWTASVPAETYPGPERHEFTGNSFDDLTIESKGAANLMARCPCAWTGRVVDGVVTSACAQAFAAPERLALPAD